MKTFFINNEVEFTYDNLLWDINRSENYYPQYISEDIYSFFVNLLLAIIHNKPLSLIDSDVNLVELDNLDVKLINISEPVYKNPLNSILDIIKKVENSKAEITLFTSGTTGQPKRVVHSVQSLIRNVRKSREYENHIWAYAYNPTHMAGLQVFFQAFMNMNKIVNVFTKSRNEVLYNIDRFSVTHISGTPTFYRLLLPFEKSYNSVQRVTLGGEKSDMRLYNSLKQVFPESKINNIYASTEAGSLFSSQGEFFKIPTEIQGRIRVVDNELYIHKSLLGKSDSFIFNGEDYYRTGDLIEWENKENGLFRFKGRTNELINIGGYKVNPGEIEGVISQLQEINQVVVYGKSNSVLGNILCADIVLNQHYTLTELSIRDHLKGFLQDFKIPRRIRFVDTIELTRTGKLKRV